MKASVFPSSTGLSARNLCFHYDGHQVIADVNLELKPGTLTALVGPNGAGKSTLLHLLQGRLKQTSGSVQCNGRVALMPQRASIDWNFPITVAAMVNLGKTGSNTKNEAPATEAVLERLGIKEMGRRRLSQLSGGQQQRVLLARALMQHSDVLLLDEPCSAIDPPTREHLLDVMRQQACSGQTLLISSHDWGSALDHYDNVIVLDRQILASGTPDDVRDKLSDISNMMGTNCYE